MYQLIPSLGYVDVLNSYPNQPTTYLLHPVVLTDPSLTNDMYPPGARAVLGYGVNPPPAGSPANTSLVFLRSYRASMFNYLKFLRHSDY